MKDKRGIPEILLIILTEQLLLFPVTLSVFLMVHVARIWVVYCLILIFSSLVLPIYAYIPDRWQVCSLAGAFTITACTLILLFGLSVGTITAFIVCSAFMFRSYWLIKHWNQGFSFFFFVTAGIISYIVITLLYSHSETYGPYLIYIAVGATFAFVAGCFCINLTTIGYERRIVNKILNVPKRTTASNTLLLVIFMALVLVVASLSFIDRLLILFDQIFIFLGNIVHSILDWYSSLFSAKDAVPFQMMPFQQDAAAVQRGTSPFIKYLGLALLSAGLAFALYLLFKKCIALFVFLVKKFVNLLRKITAGQDGMDIVNRDDEDEVTSLLKEGESTLDAAKRWLSSNRGNDRPYFTLQTNAERARWIYKHSARKALSNGIPLKGWMTSREVLNRIQAEKNPSDIETAEPAADAYNTARYGSREPSDKAIENLKGFYLSKRSRV